MGAGVYVCFSKMTCQCGRACRRRQALPSPYVISANTVAPILAEYSGALFHHGFESGSSASTSMGGGGPFLTACLIFSCLVFPPLHQIIQRHSSSISTHLVYLALIVWHSLGSTFIGEVNSTEHRSDIGHQHLPLISKTRILSSARDQSNYSSPSQVSAKK